MGKKQAEKYIKRIYYPIETGSEFLQGDPVRLICKWHL